MQAPSDRYLLATDQLGRDLLSRLIFGAQISLTVGLAATAVNVVAAVLIGGISGFFGGRLDLAVQRFVDAWMAFPGLLLLLTIMSLVGRGLPQIIVVLGVTGGIGGSRVIRGAVIGVKENVYFQAAEAIGSTKWRMRIPVNLSSDSGGTLPLPTRQASSRCWLEVVSLVLPRGVG